MSGKKEFIELIKNKCAGNPYDIEEYVSTIDKLIAKVYRNRYGSLLDARTENGSLRVDFETFQNDCWEALEDNGLVLKFRDASFSEDSHLIGYIKKTFENMLQDRIYELSPGSRTRMKQVNRVLQPNTLDACKRLCHCWKLREFKDVTLAPADLDRLMHASNSLTPPNIHIRKKSDGEMVPTIRDKEMEHYLVSLLKGAGGMTTRTDLLSFITVQYALFPVKQVAPLNREHTEEGDAEESPEEQIARIAWKADGVMIGLDHVLSAKDLAAAMSPRMKEVYYRRIINGETMVDAARKMKKSVGTISNIENEYRKLFIEYFWNHQPEGTPEEEACVGRMVSELILTMRGKE
jgi:hypothetical protein